MGPTSGSSCPTRTAAPAVRRRCRASGTASRPTTCCAAARFDVQRGAGDARTDILSPCRTPPNTSTVTSSLTSRPPSPSREEANASHREPPRGTSTDEARNDSERTGLLRGRAGGRRTGSRTRGGAIPPFGAPATDSPRDRESIPIPGARRGYTMPPGGGGTDTDDGRCGVYPRAPPAWTPTVPGTRPHQAEGIDLMRRSSGKNSRRGTRGYRPRHERPLWRVYPGRILTIAL